jgi:hypothetical protein
MFKNPALVNRQMKGVWDCVTINLNPESYVTDEMYEVTKFNGLCRIWKLSKSRINGQIVRHDHPTYRYNWSELKSYAESLAKGF